MKAPQLVPHVLLINPEEAKARIITLPKPDFLQEIHLDPLNIFLLRLFLANLHSLVFLIQVANLRSFIQLWWHSGRDALVFLKLILEHAEDLLFDAKFDLGYLSNLIFQFLDFLYILFEFLLQI